MASKFDFAAAVAERPSFAQRDAFYGRYTYTERGGGWVTPDRKWEAENLVYIPIGNLPGFPKLYGTQALTRVSMHRKVAPIFIASWAIVVEQGLHRRLHSFDGCYATRHMQNNVRLPLSNHAKGSAIDFDASTNAMGIPHSQMKIDRQFVYLMEGLGWAWGGRWATSDGMHFEWVDQDPSVAPAHQDKLALSKLKVFNPAPKLSHNPQSDLLGMEVDTLILNGNPYNIKKASKVRNILYVQTKE